MRVVSMSTSKSCKRQGRKRRRRRSVASFLWRDVRIYLPNIFISKELQEVANTYTPPGSSKLKTLECVQNEEVWNPSWSEDEDDDDASSVKSKGFGFRRKSFNKIKTEDDTAATVLLLPTTPKILSPSKNSNERFETDTGSADPKTTTEDTEGRLKVKVGRNQRRYVSKNVLFKNLVEGVQKEQNTVPDTQGHVTKTAETETTSTSPSTSKFSASKISENSRNNDVKTSKQCPALNLLAVSSELKCPECGKTFLKSIHLSLHQKIHAQMKKKFQINSASAARCGEIVCAQCGRKFETRNQWKFHMKMCRAKKSKVAPGSGHSSELEGAEEVQFKSAGNDVPNLLSFQQPTESSKNESGIDNSYDTSIAQHSAFTFKQLKRENFTCSDCGRTFKKQHYLHFHKKSHFKSCSKCGSKIHETKISQHDISCNASVASQSPEAVEPLNVESEAEPDLLHLIPKLETEEPGLVELHGVEFFEDMDSPTGFLSKLPITCEILGCSSRFSDSLDKEYHLRKVHYKEEVRPPFEVSSQRPNAFRLHIGENSDGSQTFDAVSEPPRHIYHDFNDLQNLPNPYVLLIKHNNNFVTTASSTSTSIKSNFKKTSDHNELKGDKRKSESRRGRFREDIPHQNCYTCQTCKKIFYKRNLYIIHLGQHRREDKYRCQICSRGFLSDSQLQTHLERHSDPSYDPNKVGAGRFRTDIPIQDTYTCSMCDKIFDKRNAYLLHLREEKFKCQICKKGFLSGLQLQLHVKRCSDPSYVPKPRIRTDIPFQDTYTCSMCDKIFDKRKAYLLHLREEKFKCQICQKGFQSDLQLQLHVKRCSDPSYVPKPRIRTDIPFQDTYTCSMCDKIFHNRTAYLLHLREEQFKCQICKRGFLSDSQLQAHIERHADPSYDPNKPRFRADIPIQDSYMCNKCDKFFDKRQNYLIHLSSHKREEKYKCEICKVGFQSKILLGAHRKRHKDPSYSYTPRTHFRTDIPLQNVYHCKICDKKINKRHFYLVHLSLHRREEQYTCGTCGKKFGSKKLLESHEKQHDPSYIQHRRKRSDIPFQNVYRCEICQKEFKLRRKFVHHLWCHKRIPRFECHLCPSKFFARRALLDHAIRHSDPTFQRRPGRRQQGGIPAQDTYTCVECGKQFTERQKYIMHVNYHKMRKKNEHQEWEHNLTTSQIDLASTEAKRFKCDDCLKTFGTKHILALHRHRYCKKVPCQFKCTHCSARFANKITFARHQEKMHGDKKKGTDTLEDDLERHHCSFCSQTFTTPFGLTKHTAIYHSVERNFMGMGNYNVDENKGNDNVSPDNDNSDFNYDLSALNFCETEILENSSPKEEPTLAVAKKKTSGNPKTTLATRKKSTEPATTSVARKKTGGGGSTGAPTSEICTCSTAKFKYKSQKFCHSARCPCVQAGSRCDKWCSCRAKCLNTDARESEQLQIFRESRESMMLEESSQQISPNNDDLLDEDDEFCSPSIPIVCEEETSVITSEANQELSPQNTQNTSSRLQYSTVISTSEYISINEEQDDSIRELALAGYVEESGLEDPLADSPEAEPVLVEDIAEDTRVSSNNCGEKGFRCQFCKKYFKVIPGYITHMLNHLNDSDAFDCPICCSQFGSITEYLHHMDEHNKISTKLQCIKCSSKFISPGDLQKHVKVYHSKPMECGLCSIKFSDSTSLLTHWTKDHPTCQCGLCSVKFFSYEDLTLHMRALHSPFECSRCSERKETVDEIIVHFMQQHLQDLPERRFVGGSNPNASRSLKCVFCHNSFADRVSLNQHLLNHLTQVEVQVGTPESQKSQPKTTLRCDTCKQTFSTESDLHEHLTDHILGGPSTNTASRQSSSSDVGLALYSGASQSIEPRDNAQPSPGSSDNIQAAEAFSCEKCARQFQTRRHLVTHLRQQHKDCFLCSSCLSIFSTLAELHSHLQASSCTILECNVCCKNFIHNKYLSKHMKTHDMNLVSVPTNQSSSFSSVNADAADEQKHASGFPVIVASTSLAQPPQQEKELFTVGIIRQVSVRPSWNMDADRQPEEIILD